MKNRKRLAVLLISIMLMTQAPAYAVINMTLDRDYVDFRVMENGQSLEVSDQGVYHNQVTCNSTNGIPWYLKAEMVRKFTSGMHTIPNESFQWKVVNVVNGRGIVMNNVNTPNAFTDRPSLIYTSDPADNTGIDVGIQLRYILNIPRGQISGNYTATVRWTMTELL